MICDTLVQISGQLCGDRTARWGISKQRVRAFIIAANFANDASAEGSRLEL
jgi:hypothetical protein